MTSPAITLTHQEYEARRAKLVQECSQAVRAYEEAALLHATGGAGPEILADLRAERDACYRSIDDLDAAWKAAQEYAVVAESEDDERRRREAYEAASEHLANAARVVGEIVRTAHRLGDLVEEAVGEDQEARRSVTPLLNRRDQESFPMRLVFFDHDLQQMLEAVQLRFIGSRIKEPELGEVAEARAEVARKRFASMLGQDTIQQGAHD